jgi:WD40 repeat protein
MCLPLLQEYNYHLGAVNTVTFFDEGRRFVSSSDDKTLRVWEFGIPVQVRQPVTGRLHGRLGWRGCAAMGSGCVYVMLKLCSSKNSVLPVCCLLGSVWVLGLHCCMG